MKDNQTIAQFLGLSSKLKRGHPFRIKNDKGKDIYVEECTGFWWREEHNERGQGTYFENSVGVYSKHEYDEHANLIYSENNHGVIFDNRPKPKIELTLQEIAVKLNIPVEQLRIKE
jgi:hypothetical protein